MKKKFKYKVGEILILINPGTLILRITDRYRLSHAPGNYYNIKHFDGYSFKYQDEEYLSNRYRRPKNKKELNLAILKFIK